MIHNKTHFVVFSIILCVLLTNFVISQRDTKNSESFLASQRDTRTGLFYQVFVSENGNSIVILAIENEGLFTISLPEDVNEVVVKGALYLQKNNTLTVSTGSLKKAVVIYQTSLFTTKLHDNWLFNFKGGSYTEVFLPKKAVVKSVTPLSLVEEGSYKRIVFNGAEQIEISYKFPNKLDELHINKVEITKYIMPLGILLAGLIAAVVYYRIYRAKKNNLQVNKLRTDTKRNDTKTVPSAQQNIIQTLPKNEAEITQILLNNLITNNQGMKRSTLEKVSKISKSSLASALYNLEKKNILKIDKTFASHYTNLSDWFKNLGG